MWFLDMKTITVQSKEIVPKELNDQLLSFP